MRQLHAITRAICLHALYQEESSTRVLASFGDVPDGYSLEQAIDTLDDQEMLLVVVDEASFQPAVHPSYSTHPTASRTVAGQSAEMKTFVDSHASCTYAAPRIVISWQDVK